MRYLWIEDFDGGKSGRTEIKRELEEYFQLKNKNINLGTLEQALEFLDVPSNWNLFDAILIDIRFKVCEKEQDKITIYDKYFSSFLTKDKYDYYTYQIKGDANTASSGVLLYLALLHKYNYNHNRIAFVSANVDDISDKLVDINNMREYLSKAKYVQLEELDKEEFSMLNESLFELYMKEMNFDEEEANTRFPIPEKDSIDWEDLDRLENQIDDAENQIRAVLKKYREQENDDLKYNSVRKEFEKVGLKVPIAFEKPGGAYKSDISWKFKIWVEEVLKVEYYQLRASILPICIHIERLLDCSDCREKMSYNKILENNHDKTVDVKNMLSEIVELFPANVWTENNTSLYVRIIRECVSLCDEIKFQKSSQGTMIAEAAVLKIVRNWMSHQGIKNIMAYDVAFIFYLLMVAFFSYDVDDNTEDYNYIEVARQLILEFDNRQLIVDYHFDEQINRIEEIVRNRHKEAYERFKIKVGPEKTKQLKKNYFYSDGASVYETISAIGNQYSDLRESVSMEYIYLLYLKTVDKCENKLEKSLADKLVCSKVFEK